MEATVVFPHQLFRPHPAVRPGRRIWLLEDPLFFGTDRLWPLVLHAQKLWLHRTSLAEFADELRAAGHDPVLVPCPATPSTTGELLEKTLPPDVASLHVVDPADDVLLRRLRRWTETRRISLVVLPSPNFLTPGELWREHFGGERKPFQARFYIAQRQRLQLLLEPDGSPRGGRWSFDAENRRKLPARAEVPVRPTVADSTHLRAAAQTLARDFPSAPGGFERGLYPTTRPAAREWLTDFFTWRFHHFGRYEDAISAAHPILFHSVLTPALNLGLLDPRQVIAQALAVADAQQVPLPSLEGFVRQIVGWREFIRGAYEYRGVALRRGNFWGFTRRLPPAFLTGTTGIPPVDHVVQKVRATGYCHHIERLMVLGNFLLLCRVHPDEVYRWFMAMFVDAYDWVMVPNVYGMSQFSDGGALTTKPYLSGANYILKMSDFPRGPWCEIWDALFWTFVADYRGILAENPRLKILTQSENTRAEKLLAHRRTAERFLEMAG